jgi:hypothetical protein
MKFEHRLANAFYKANQDIKYHLSVAAMSILATTEVRLYLLCR